MMWVNREEKVFVFVFGSSVLGNHYFKPGKKQQPCIFQLLSTSAHYPGIRVVCIRRYDYPDRLSGTALSTAPEMSSSSPRKLAGVFAVD
jgi:hypothetical protein